ncbi:hypothetical protein [Natronorubrum sp. DTA28]|uniref:hypothetical protein n=1 Tax=Natronorubrum sp. DTA28 TaxID=3447019 RepID=UPI003F841A5C
MDITVSLRHGPLNIEIEADTEEDYREEILGLAEFFNENGEQFEAFDLPTSPEQEYTENGEGEAQQVTLDFSDESSESETATTNDPDGPLAPIAKDLRMDEGLLEEILDADPEGEKSPILLLNETNILGDLKKDRQATASLILLHVWKECNGEERVSSSDLKEALEDSGVSSSNMYNMYGGNGKRYFDTKGKGASATIALRRPGKRQAREEIKNLIEELNIA